MLSLYYHKLMGKIEEHEEKNYFMVGGNILDKVLYKNKKIIGIEKFGYTKILIETGDKLPDDINFKNIVVLITYGIKDDDMFVKVSKKLVNVRGR